MVVSYELEEAGFGKVFKFPAPIEVWVGSYTMESDTKSYFQIVSDLSRDMDGFLYLKPEPKLEHKPERFRPLARYG